MSKSPFIKRAQQRGDILLEALLGVLLLGIIGLGIVHVTSRVSVSQKDMNVHNLVVSKLRSELLAGNLAYNDSIEAGQEHFTVTPHTQNVTIKIDGTDVEVPMSSLSATKQGDDSYTICVGAVPCDS